MEKTEAERIDITGMPIGELPKIYSEYEVYIERLGDRVYLVRTNVKKSNRAERKYKYAEYIMEKAGKRYEEAKREYAQDIEIQKLRRFIENVVENYLNTRAKKG